MQTFKKKKTIIINATYIDNSRNRYKKSDSRNNIQLIRQLSADSCRMSCCFELFTGDVQP